MTGEFFWMKIAPQLIDTETIIFRKKKIGNKMRSFLIDFLTDF